MATHPALLQRDVSDNLTRFGDAHVQNSEAHSHGDADLFAAVHLEVPDNVYRDRSQDEVTGRRDACARTRPCQIPRRSTGSVVFADSLDPTMYIWIPLL